MDNGVDRYINWAGFYNENKFALLNDHDLFVLPSRDENFGNPIIERLRTIEKPVVAAVNGVAAGAGANIALACDIVIAKEIKIDKEKKKQELLFRL